MRPGSSSLEILASGSGCKYLSPTNRSKSVRIRNGYEKRNELYYRNPRVRRVQLQVTAGKTTTSSDFRIFDTPAYQTLHMNVKSATLVKITILKVYAGESFLGRPPYDDTSISDVQIIPQMVVQ